MFGKDNFLYISSMKKRKYPSWMIPELFQLLIFAVGVGLVLMFVFWVIIKHI